MAGPGSTARPRQAGRWRGIVRRHCAAGMVERATLASFAGGQQGIQPHPLFALLNGPVATERKRSSVRQRGLIGWPFGVCLGRAVGGCSHRLAQTTGLIDSLERTTESTMVRTFHRLASLEVTRLRSAGVGRGVRPAGPLRVTNADASLPTMFQGLAIGELPDPKTSEHIAAGRSEIVLRRRRMAEGSVYFVTPTAMHGLWEAPLPGSWSRRGAAVSPTAPSAGRFSNAAHFAGPRRDHRQAMLALLRGEPLKGDRCEPAERRLR